LRWRIGNIVCQDKVSEKIMGLFGGKGDAPPDIGQEEKYDEEKGLTKKSDKDDDKLEKMKAGDSVPQEIAREAKSVVGGAVVPTSAVGLSNVQIESINARIDSIVEWIKQFYERFSYVSESIGEIRTMTMNNEKRISEEVKEANKVIDVVKEVKPEELRISYQKSEMKMTALAEKIEANKLFMDEVMKEMNELRRKSEVFIGTEGIMKLNNDTKRDLVEVQKLSSKTRMQADKAQEIFMELRKGFAESQKVGAIVENLDSSYAGLKEAIERLKLEHGDIVKRSDFLDFKKTYGTKLTLFDANVADVEAVKKSMSSMGDLIETSLGISRRNEEDIGEIGLKIGVEGVKRVSDYENQMMDMVGVIETLSKQLAELKTKFSEMTGDGKRVTDDLETNKKLLGKLKKIVKPSEGSAEKVAAVKVAEVPKLKPEEFLGKKNIVEKSGERDMAEVGKKIAKTEKGEDIKAIGGDVKPRTSADSTDLKKGEVSIEKKERVGIGGMIKKIATRVMPEKKEVVKEEKEEGVKKVKKKKKRRKRVKKKGGSKGKGSKGKGGRKKGSGG